MGFPFLKKVLNWNWNGAWERLQEAWTLKIGSTEPQVCWGCVGGRSLVVAGDSVIEQGWFLQELAPVFGFGRKRGKSFL